MDRRTELYIINILRHGTITWHVRNEVLNRGRRVRIVGVTKKGLNKTVYENNCECCGIWRDLKDNLFEVDHIVEIGSFNGNFDDYVRRMYCSIDNLQRLCFSCHKKKTSKFNSTLTFQRKVKKAEDIL